MKKNLLIALCALSTVMAASTYAVEVKKPNLSAVKSAVASNMPQATEAEKKQVRTAVQNINTKFSAASVTVYTAAQNLYDAIAPKEKAATLKKDLNAINSRQDLSNAEKSALKADVLTKTAEDIKANKDSYSAAIKEATAEKKLQVSKSLTNLGNAANQYLVILEDTNVLLTNLSNNPGLLTAMGNEIGILKDTGKELKENGKALKSVIKNSLAVATASGLDVKVDLGKKEKTSKSSAVDLSKLKK